MFVRQIPNKKTGRTAVCIIQSYRDVSTGNNRSRVIENLGFLDVLEREHEDPIAWAKLRAADLTRQAEEGKNQYRLSLDGKEKIPQNETLRKNIGYAAFSKLYHQLEIDEFMDNRRRYTKREHNPNSVLKMLVFNRLLFPDSKKGAWEGRHTFLEDSAYSLDNVYSSLDFLLKYRTDLMAKLHEKICRIYHRDTLLLFYDVTNYYFEIDENDTDITGDDGVVSEGLRKKGYSKEHRTTPIVQLGLFMDEMGIPVSYELFPGNCHDSKTLIPMMDASFDDFGMSHMIVVADKGMMGGDNIRDILLKHKGYVISSSARKADAKFTAYMLNQEGYTELYDKDTGILEFKYKSRTTPRYIKVTSPSGGKSTVKINEHQIVMWSRKYAERERKGREKVLDKTRRLIGSTSKNALELVFGSRKYILKEPVDTKGEGVNVDAYVLSLDEEKIREEESLDGYYVICTNVRGLEKGTRPFKDGQRCRFSKSDGFFELNRELGDLDIVDMYHGLWRIEETFKVTKSDLQARPVFVWTQDRIRAHFLVCFISMVLMRLLQHRLEWKYSASSIQESLSKACGTLVGGNLFAFDHFDEVLDDIGKELGIDFSNRYLTLGKMKSLIAETKK